MTNINFLLNTFKHPFSWFLYISYVGGVVERKSAELTPTNLTPGYSQSTPTRDQPVLIQARTGGTQGND